MKGKPRQGAKAQRPADAGPRVASAFIREVVRGLRCMLMLDAVVCHSKDEGRA